MKRKIYSGFDVTKFVLAIFVICIHTHPFKETTNPFLLFWTQYGFHFAVPMFFAIAGFLLFAKTKELPLENSLPDIKKYLINIVRLYIIWNLVYFPIAVYGYIKLGIHIKVAIYQYVRDFFLIGEHYLSWHLWYLLGTIYGLLIITLMIKFHFSNFSMLLCGFLFYILSVFIDWNVGNINSYNGIIHVFLKVVSHTIVKGRLLTGTAFLCMGMYIARNNWIDKLMPQYRIMIIAVLSFAYALHPNVFGELVLKPMIIFCCVWFLSAIKTNSKSLYVNLRKLSTVFYHTHMLFVFTFSLMTNSLYPEGFKCFAFVLAGCVLSGFAFLQKEKIKGIFLQRMRCQ